MYEGKFHVRLSSSNTQSVFRNIQEVSSLHIAGVEGLEKVLLDVPLHTGPLPGAA